MARFQREYKKIGFGFGSSDESRFIRADKHEEFRKNQRSKTFNENRILTESPHNTPLARGHKTLPVVEDHLKKLKKWKAERDKRKKMEKIKKKPPFKVGIVHHRLYSPMCNDSTTSNAIRTKISALVDIPRRITRATEKRLMAKKVARKEKPKAIEKGISSLVIKDQRDERKLEQSFAPVNHKFKPPSGLTEIPMFGTIHLPLLSPVNQNMFLFSPPKVVAPNVTDDAERNNVMLNESISKTAGTKDKSVHSDSPGEPVFFSPYVVSSRGKSKARKEQQIRRGFSIGHSPSDDVPMKDTVMKNFNISIEEEERTAQYFHFLMNREVDRLNEMCKKWADIKLESDVTEDALYLIRQAIGQTTLLINKKIQRFRGLVSDCETGKGEMLVTCKDLQGFWDLIYMEVRNCDSRFAKLEELRSRDWEEEHPVINPIAKKRVPTKKKKVSVKGSSVRAFMAEKKKKLAQMAETVGTTEELETKTEQILNNASVENENSVNSKYRITRKSKLIGFDEQKQTPTKRENVQMSLLQKAHLSETYKKIRSPLTVMKVSKMWKTPEIQLDDSITYVNSDQTPGKSILKRSKDLDNSFRSANKVNFDDHVVSNKVPIDDETSTRLYLAEALARTESIDFDSHKEAPPINVGRKLTFGDDSLGESKGANTANEQCALPLQNLWSDNPKLRKKTLRRQNAVEKKETPLINISLDTSSKGLFENMELHVSRIASPKQIFVIEDQEPEKTDTSVRILRNRTITTASTPNSKRRSSKQNSENSAESEQKENKTPQRIRRKNSMKVSISDKEKSYSKIDLEDAIKQISLNENNSNRRKSTRRSVKFSEKDCTGCVDGKVQLPMTPHVRRSKLRSSETRRGSTIVEDLISWETPEKLPERVSRSSHKKP